MEAELERLPAAPTRNGEPEWLADRLVTDRDLVPIERYWVVECQLSHVKSRGWRTAAVSGATPQAETESARSIANGPESSLRSRASPHCCADLPLACRVGPRCVSRGNARAVQSTRTFLVPLSAYVDGEYVYGP